MNTINKEYKFVLESFQKIEKTVLADIEKSNFIETNKALYYNTKKIDILVGSLIKSADSFYSSQVLMRVILEHFLVGSYIWTRSRIDNNDSCGTEYKMEYLVSEFFKRESYKVSIDNIQNNSKIKFDIDSIKTQHEVFKEMNQNDLDSIHKVANQFDIRKIGDYLVNKIPKEDLFIPINRMMLEFLNKYNFLSSYVHGGPYSQRETFLYEFNINQKQTLTDNIHWGQIASKQTKINLMQSLLRDFPDSYKITIEKLLKI